MIKAVKKTAQSEAPENMPEVLRGCKVDFIVLLINV